MKKSTTFIIPAILVVVFGVGYLLSQTSPKSNTKTIVIGAAIALTGDGVSWGDMSLKGAQMAVDEINSTDGINNKQIRLIVEDTQSTAIGSTSAVQKLVNVDKVSAVLGPTWLDVYQGAQGAVVDKNIPMISVDAGVEAVNVPRVYQNVFSLWYRSQAKAELLMNHVSSIGAKRMAVVHQNDSYYEDFGNRLEKEAQKRGIKIVRRERVNVGEGDFKTLLTKLKTDKPDIIFAAFYDQISIDAFFRNRTQLYPDLKITSDEFGQDFVDNENYRSFVDGMLFFSAIIQNQSFEQRFRERYNGQNPKFGASNGYDAIMMLVKALREQPSNPTEYLKQNSFSTATFGEMRFDEINGVETSNQMFIMKQFINGEVKLLK